MASTACPEEFRRQTVEPGRTVRTPGGALVCVLALVSGVSAATADEVAAAPISTCADGADRTQVAGVEACVREVRFGSGALTLAGQWFTPPGAEDVPAVVFARGSGPSRRGDPWTLGFVSLLVENGFAVLLPDKRGSGESEGDWRDADFEDLADDVLAGVRFAHSRPEVRGGAVGVLGLSQGGEVVPIAAAKSEDVRFVVNVVGAAVPFVENVTYEMRHTFREEGLEGRRMRVAMEMVETAVGYLRGEVSWAEYTRELEASRNLLGEDLTADYFIADSTHWRWDFFRRLENFDPVDWWRRVDQPALVLYGGADPNTPSERSAERLRRAFGETGHPESRVEVFPGLGHALWDTSGPLHEHGLHPDVRDVLMGWLEHVLGDGPGDSGRARPHSAGWVESDDGVRLRFRMLGSGSDTLVVLHGGPGAGMSSVLPAVRPLGEDRVLLLYDQRGGGRSTLPEDTAALRPEDFVRDLEAVRRHFGLERIQLFTHSFGAILAARYAVRYPDRIERLVLHGATGPNRKEAAELARSSPVGDSAAAARYRELLVRLVRGEAEDPVATCRELEEAGHEVARSRGAEVTWTGTTCDAPPEAVRYYYRYTARIAPRGFGDWDFTGRLGEVEAPVLVIWGARDSAAVPAQRAWGSAYPNGRLLLVPRAGKAALTDRPDTVREAVDTFLGGAWPDGAVRVEAGSR